MRLVGGGVMVALVNTLKDPSNYNLEKFNSKVAHEAIAECVTDVLTTF